MKVNELNYTPLKEIPLENPSYPRFCKVAKVAILIFTGIALGVAIGVATAISLGFPPLTMGIVAALIGSIAGGVFGFLDKELEPIVKYRVQNLEQLEKSLIDPKILGAIQGLKKIFNDKLPAFVQSYEVHALHDRLTLISEGARVREDIQKIWKAFLGNMKDFKVKWPDGSINPVDCSLEMDRLEGKKVSYKVEKLINPSDADLNQIVEIEKESFGPPGTFPADQMKLALNHPTAFLYVARREGSSEILGFNWGRAEENDPNTLVVYGIARKGAASRLAIGDKLLDKLVEDSGDRDMRLNVRASNSSAIDLYKKKGFVTQSVKKGYYDSLPKEDALVMRRPANQKLAHAV